MKFGAGARKDNSGDWMDHRPGVNRQKHPTTKQVRESLRAARHLLPECIDVLRDEFLRNKKCPGASRLKAIGMLLDRGLGKPVQQMIHEDREPLEQMPRTDRIAVLEEALAEEKAALEETLQ